MLQACDIDDARVLLLIDSFLSDLMASQDIDYQETAALTKALFVRMPNAKAIGYPSVKCRGGMNLAVKPDNFWNDWMLKMVTSTIFESPGYGIYKPLSRKNVKGITSAGDLQWGQIEINVNMGAELNPGYQENPMFPIRP